MSALNQSAQAVAASASEERDKTADELAGFVTSMKEKDEEHKSVLAKVEESLMQARDAYGWMIAGEADLKERMEEMKKNHEAEIGDLKLESADLSRKVDELRLTKIWLLTEGA
ncbi:hypothetical protein Hanom_Chr05g00445561 [Helianthus anomalus]